MLTELRMCILCKERPSYTKPNGDKSRLCISCRWQREKQRLKGETLDPLPSLKRKEWTGICEVEGCDEKTISETHFTCNSHGWQGRNKDLRNQYQKDRRDVLKWGLPEGTGTAVIEFQEGLCAVCQKSTEENGQQFDYDHDHETKIFRGLLCRRCNRTIVGIIENNYELVQRALMYLEKPPAQQLFPGLKITREYD